MKNNDVVINGYSPSVIEHLIQRMDYQVKECLCGLPEKDGLRIFSKKNACFMEMIAKWAMIALPAEFNTVKELNNFLGEVRTLIIVLTPDV